ncbi:Wadjet anti-phage system protein JetD domain-containing protein [Brenneria corticis]|uniref:Wadjet protein JetD C-terminal domain-containing protein n=1 Tax=Brenneria corticis TaxID=2173106 RepID=A0A2U1U7P2_9GAMM|nr:Wadjet anti-phage system protein JetD domain-containing protein [Brenneria sp. CFCC 11842]PWC17686.1 hypothetical protein DDT56_05360 [Brenneria sp. CFCC 11842]
MKSPQELQRFLARQWQSAEVREQRLSGDGWPWRLTIGRPSARLFTEQTARVREHIQAWRAVDIGEVCDEQYRYRSGGEPVALPGVWQLASPDEWVAATGDRQIAQEYRQLTLLLSHIDRRFHRLFIRQRSLWRGKDNTETLAACSAALKLTPGCANGMPLRALALNEIDSKFFERHQHLLTSLLDVLYHGQAGREGLTTFLGASAETAHWLLLVPLAPGLLPFAQLRVRAQELSRGALPAGRILLIENERCLHQLPPLADTIAILGAGLDLEWLDSAPLRAKRLAYWGDMDSWGMTMLAKARQYQPEIQALMMDKTCFERYAPDYAVAEPEPAQALPSPYLTSEEREFYRYLQQQEKGRLEQERLPADLVTAVLRQWHQSTQQIRV